MKAIKILAVLLGIYVLVVVVFESLLGYYQPGGEYTMVITTTDDNGEPHPRVVAALEHEGQLYVAANHWPRAWYGQVLERPQLTVQRGEAAALPYQAVELTEDEFNRVNTAHHLPLFFRILTGFPPREILRLDPMSSLGTPG